MILAMSMFLSVEYEFKMLAEATSNFQQQELFKNYSIFIPSQQPASRKQITFITCQQKRMMQE